MKITEHDSITGDTIDRDATAEELAELDEATEAAAEFEAAKAAKEAAKQAVLDKLGLTAKELAALI